MFDAPARPAPLRIEIEASADAAAVEALVLAAFGPGRFAKTAERLRERVWDRLHRNLQVLGREGKQRARWKKAKMNACLPEGIF